MFCISVVRRPLTTPCRTENPRTHASPGAAHVVGGVRSTLPRYGTCRGINEQSVRISHTLDPTVLGFAANPSSITSPTHLPPNRGR